MVHNAAGMRPVTTIEPLTEDARASCLKSDGEKQLLNEEPIRKPRKVSLK